MRVFRRRIIGRIGAGRLVAGEGQGPCRSGSNGQTSGGEESGDGDEGHGVDGLQSYDGRGAGTDVERVEQGSSSVAAPATAAPSPPALFSQRLFRISGSYRTTPPQTAPAIPLSAHPPPAINMSTVFRRGLSTIIPPKVASPSVSALRALGGKWGLGSSLTSDCRAYVEPRPSTIAHPQLTR